MSDTAVRGFVIEAKDNETGKLESIKIAARSVGDAAKCPAIHGMQIVSISNPETGRIYFPTPGGGFKAQTLGPDSRPKNQDMGLLVISFLIPLVGVIAGAIRMSKNEPNGLPPILASLAGGVIFMLMIAASHH